MISIEIPLGPCSSINFKAFVISTICFSPPWCSFFLLLLLFSFILSYFTLFYFILLPVLYLKSILCHNNPSHIKSTTGLCKSKYVKSAGYIYTNSYFIKYYDLSEMIYLSEIHNDSCLLNCSLPNWTTI